MLKNSQSSCWLQAPQAAQQTAASRCCTGSQDLSEKLSQFVLSASTLGTHLDAPADVIHNPDCPTVLVSWQGLRESGDLHLPFGLGTGFLSVDGFTGGTLQTAILPGDRSHIRAAEPPAHRGLVRMGQPSTLFPLEYMASTQSRWKECWQFLRRPTASGLMLLEGQESL